MRGLMSKRAFGTTSLSNAIAAERNRLKTDGSRSGFVYDEDAAFLFTGPFQIVAYRNRRPDARETEQLTTRVHYATFNNEARHQRSTS